MANPGVVLAAWRWMRSTAFMTSIPGHQSAVFLSSGQVGEWVWPAERQGAEQSLMQGPGPGARGAREGGEQRPVGEIERADMDGVVPGRLADAGRGALADVRAAEDREGDQGAGAREGTGGLSARSDAAPVTTACSPERSTPSMTSAAVDPSPKGVWMSVDVMASSPRH
ncbi:hypothetical protein SAV31267_002280 [Streptomyces avermitilis]|uniref:Uncharacterized protein n=1 Tax=Streptomyces avermitilis TaxID=33903 RepID=A0A4D4MFK0_STRAX|nr:hypothetical protein SAV31267_002280 [Streptomyces avermitilis]